MNSIKEILKKYQIKPSKRLGQNFLVDERVLRKIIEAANLSKNDTVLEIGPGIGNLTRELAKRAKKVIAVEKDRKMVEILKGTLKEFKNINVFQGDILKIQISNLKIQPRPFSKRSGAKFKIVANIPYYLTSPLIRKFLEMENQPILMVLMVQKEVAQRICAKPPDMNLLAVSVQFYVHPVKCCEAAILPKAKLFNRAGPEIIAYVSKKSFWPSPKVDSAIIKITPKSFPEVQPLSILQGSDPCKLFFKIVKAGFSHPRKQLINNLAKGLNIDRKEVENWLLKNGIQPSQRAETLTIEDWLNLAKNYKMLKYGKNSSGYK